MTPIEIAKIVHNLNKMYCEYLGDTSQADWDEAPQWQKDSALIGVNLHLEYPDISPSDTHASWLKVKVEAGWVYGEVKDPEANPPTHPCVVPYADLPKEQKFKDTLFKSTVDFFRVLVAA